MLGGIGSLFAQENTTTKALNFSGYAEAYYLYDFNNPIGNTRPNFIYSHNRNNEVNVNLAFLKQLMVRPTRGPTWHSLQEPI